MASADVMVPLVLALFVNLLCPSAAATCSVARVSGSEDPLELAVGCSRQSAKVLPRHLFNASVVDLDVSLNDYQNLTASAFKGLANLRKLNISACHIGKMSPATFEGLDLLVELDMSFNPVIHHSLPAGLLDRVPGLRVLSLRGYVIDDVSLSSVGRLNGLEEIFITPDFAKMPYSLAKLPKLRSVYFYRCAGATTLTAPLLSPFTESSLEQLAFVDCGISAIENSTFDNFTGLRVLNFAKNDQLRLHDIINALSTSSGVAVSTLIADLTGYKKMPIFLGLSDYPTCRSGWRNLRRLSIRGANIFGLGHYFHKCISNLEAVAAGYNPIMIYPKSVTMLYLVMQNRLKVLDLIGTRNPDLKTLKDFSGFGKHSIWIKRNDDYFALPRLPDMDNPGLDQAVQDGCTLLSVPSALEYVLGESSFIYQHNEHKYACNVFAPNRIRYINVSYPLNSHPLTFNTEIRGLSRLEVLDISGFRLMSFNWKTCENLPSLRFLRMADNILSHCLPNRLPRMNNLTDLDLSGNGITSLSKSFFADLITLRRLLLANNRLNFVDFNLPDTIRFLDLSGNVILIIGEQIRNKLDALSGVELQFRDNLLLCGCDEAEVVQWFQQTTVQIVDRNLTRCIQNEQLPFIVDVNLWDLKAKCNHVVVTASVSVTAVVFVTVMSLVCYRIRYRSPKTYNLLI